MPPDNDSVKCWRNYPPNACPSNAWKIENAETKEMLVFGINREASALICRRRISWRREKQIASCRYRCWVFLMQQGWYVPMEQEWCGGSWPRSHIRARSTVGPWRSWIAPQEWARPCRRAWRKIWCFGYPLCWLVVFWGRRFGFEDGRCSLVVLVVCLLACLIDVMLMMTAHIRASTLTVIYQSHRWCTKPHLVFNSIVANDSVHGRICYVLGSENFVVSHGGSWHSEMLTMKMAIGALPPMLR